MHEKRCITTQMNTSSFQVFWNNRYHESVPLGHHLREDYPDRWFRIHSLPESKRYADDEDERNILLFRQNALITDLLGDNAKFYLVTGRYCYADPEAFNICSEYRDLDCFKKFDLRESDAINLFKHYPDYYDEEDGIHFVPAIFGTTWKSGKFDDVLINIADEVAFAVILGISRNVAICPYDGGVDCIVENSEQVESYKRKYQDWLSRREDGL